MSAPPVEKRRKKEFAAELLARAGASIPQWELDPAARDFGMALLDIAARFDSEVAERLDRAGEKNRRGLLDWLGIRGAAARAARVPVVLRLGEQTPNAVAAPKPVKLRADTSAGPVVFETEADVTLVPGRLATLVAVDPADDAFYLPPPGIDNVEPRPPSPDSWRTRAFAPAGASRLQLSPELGLEPDMLLLVGGHQYRVAALDKDIVTLEPPLLLADGIDAGVAVTRVTSFAPFAGQAHNRQAHVLYIGDDKLLDIKVRALIVVSGLAGLTPAVKWEFWGKLEANAPAAWQPLPPPERQGGALVLTKPNGSIEPRAVGAIESRWIRAVLDKQPGAATTFDRLQLRVSQGPPVDADARQPAGGQSAVDAAPADPDPPDPDGVAPEMEVVANNTPQVLDSVFYPFGREPRMFDTFYLGCAEAFSKKEADVHLTFDLADPGMRALTVVPRLADAIPVLAAAAQDGYLHLLQLQRGRDNKSIVTQLRPPVQPPLPADGSSNADRAPRPLDRVEDGKWAARPAAWTTGVQFYVAVAARSQVWVWHEKEPGTEPSKDSGWQNYGEVGSHLNAELPITDLVAAHSFDALFALRDGKLFRHDLASGPLWSAVTLAFDPKQASADVPRLVGLSPLCRVNPDDTIGEGALPALCGLLDVGGGEGKAEACVVWLDPTTKTARCDPLPGMPELRASVRPVALYQVENGEARLAVAAVTADGERLAGWRSTAFDPASIPVTLKREGEVAKLKVGAPVLGRDLDVAMRARGLTVLAATEHALMEGMPFGDEPPISMAPSAIAADVGTASGAAVVLGSSHIAVPGTRSELLLGTVEQGGITRVVLKDGDFGAALLCDAAKRTGDTYAFEYEANGASGIKMAQVGDALQSPYPAQSLYRLDLLQPEPLKQNGGAWLFATSEAARIPERVASQRHQIIVSDSDFEIPLEAGKLLLLAFAGKMNKTIYKIESVAPVEPPTTGAAKKKKAKTTKSLVTFEQELLTESGEVTFWPTREDSAQMLPLLILNPEASARWSAAMLRDRAIFFAGLEPARQDSVEVGQGSGTRVLLLTAAWTKTPHATSAWVEVPTIDWTRQLGQTAQNPELSWEFWNGRGWWKLTLVVDDTANFQRSGTLEFKVPKDLQASEWAGKTNYWIRARLVGGDYGSEIVTAVSEPGDNDGKRQKIVRDRSEIHAPAVLQLTLTYTMKEATPAYLITEDNGTTRDQSSANHTDGAIVEAFQPLGAMLARFDAAAATPDVPGPTPCGCAACAGAADASGDASTSAGAAASGRALYLGFDARLRGDTVNVLLLPDQERNFDRFAPARVDVLRGTRFEPVVATDATRALGEAGILSITLASAPAPAELFGRTLTWLRIRPRAGVADADWKPALRGAYLNAVWAHAAETQELEMLGSSQGAPLQQVLLARPPVLKDTLELRVREPLGEEERTLLKRDDPGKVRSDVEGQPGDWVRWEQVVDPADEDARARVYGLDEGTGLIWFGDGVHGAIAPIGRDAIMAFRYLRTDVGDKPDAPVPASMVGAGSSLSIVTPLQGAEAAFAADQAAGGSPAEDIARVLRFAPAHLRQRGAVVTAGDLEQMALSLVPQAAQARCLRRAAAVQLVLVMQGAEPKPSSAVKRELRRMLLDAAAPALAATGAFAVVDPLPVPFHVRVELATESLDNSASLAASAKGAIAALFDSASGGRDGQGWQLGARPSETEIAGCLLDLPRVDGIGQVTLTEQDADGRPTPLRATLGAAELALLAADGIELQFIVPPEAP